MFMLFYGVALWNSSPLPQWERARPSASRRVFRSYASFRGLRDRRVARKIDYRQRGADALGGTVLEADYGIDRNVAFAAIDRVDDGCVLFIDDAASDFS